MLSILSILNLILALITCGFAIKILFVNFKESKSKLKNIGVLFFIVITIILSGMGGIRAISVDDHVQFLKSQGMQLNVKSETIEVLIYTALGYLFFACLWALHRNIVKEVNETKTTEGWDLNKYK